MIKTALVSLLMILSGVIAFAQMHTQTIREEQNRGNPIILQIMVYSNETKKALHIPYVRGFLFEANFSTCSFSALPLLFGAV